MGNLSSIKSIVVLMMENRSLDTWAGWIYAPENVSPNGDAFDGLTPELGNPPSPGSTEFIPVGRTTNHMNPTPDPGEPYPHVNVQLFEKNPPPDPLPAKQNLGFVWDYTNVLHMGCYPTNPATILDGFDPSVVSCTQAIAKQFAICDQWFCSVPTQTWPNRSFVHTGWSNGNLVNFPYDPMLWDVPTIFNVMARRPGSTWRVYYHDLIFPLVMVQFPQMQKFGYAKNFHHIDQFLHDAASGSLPQYAFIEPRFIADPIAGPETDAHPPHSAFIGDQFIGEIYNAIVTGPQFKANEVLFIITFDEHGGTYDHVAPFTNATPVGVNMETQFTFNRFGVRVPTIVVSPFVKKGSVFNKPAGVPNDAPPSTYTPYDHTSILKTIELAYGYPNMTARDNAAPDLGGILTEPARTDYGPVPVTGPFQELKDWIAERISRESVSKMPLNDLQVSIVAAAAHMRPTLDHSDDAQPAIVPPTPEEVEKLPRTVAEAIDFFKAKKEELGLG
jgi:phospholipase C